jgi:hypothetical protein
VIFLELTEVPVVVFMIVLPVVVDWIKVVCFVEVEVIAEGNMVHGGKVVVGIDIDLAEKRILIRDIPPFLKRSLAATCRVLKIIHIPCYQPDPGFTYKQH